MFITFEGCEGSGKTTQAKLLVEKLNAKGVDAIFTREPGGSDLAENVRNLILSNEIENPLTEFLLITAARLDHVEKLIKPALLAGKIVVCDRFLHSSLAYQGRAKGLSVQLMLDIHKLALQNFMPDITFFIDLDPSIALSRINKGREEAGKNHYDLKDIAFHSKIRDAFLDMAASSKFVKIDGARNIEYISREIMGYLPLPNGC